MGIWGYGDYGDIGNICLCSYIGYFIYRDYDASFDTPENWIGVI